MVSIIIPTHNRSYFLKSTIESILNQIYDKFEIIVIDDGSTDNTQELVTSINDKRISIYSIGRTKNVSKLRNFGVKVSSFDLIAFCDDDDLWFPDKLQKCILLSNQYDFICSNMNLINEKNIVIKDRFFEDIFEDTRITTEKLLYRNYVLTSTMFLKKSIFDHFKFDEDFYVSTAEDYAFCLQVSTKFSIFFKNENMGSYRVHNNLSNEYHNRLKLIQNQLSIVSAYKKSNNLKFRRMAYVGAFSFKFELFRWYMKNGYLLNTLKHFILLIPDIRFRENILYLSEKIRKLIKKVLY